MRKQKTVLLFVTLLVIMLLTTACDSDVQKTATEIETAAGNIQETKIGYRIVQKDNMSFKEMNKEIKRYTWHIVVNGKVTKEYLENISKEIIEIAKKDSPFNAMVIGFYDYEEYIGYGYTLGKTTYAPYGDLAKANTVTTGEYEKMDYNFELREKDWSKQLSADEIKVYKAWQDLAWNNFELDDDEVTKKIAREFKVTTKDVDNILIKSVSWMFH